MLKRAALFLLAFSTISHAAEDAAIPAERFQPALSREGFVDVEAATVGEHLDYDVALMFGYALNPLVLTVDGVRADPLIAHRVSADLLGSISLIDWVQLGVHVPMVLYQARDDAALADRFTGVGSVAFAGLGDLRLIPKLQGLRAEHSFVDLAFAVPISIPTGFPTGSYLGEGGLSVTPTALVGLPLGDLRLLANVGVELREVRTVRNLDIGPELSWRGGVSYDLESLSGVPLAVDATANGATSLLAPFTSGVNENPLEVLAGARYTIMDRLVVIGYAGAGVIGGYGVPDVRAGVGVRYAPRNFDHDKDGIEDGDDACRDVAEDKDGFEDGDGCPDADNDGDGILDTSDQCPNAAEDSDGFQDEDGCPDEDNDGDGIPDASDECPELAGVVEWRGCQMPDKDGDGVADASDRCPEQAGPPERDGCPRPDTDSDGIFDDEDSCPEVAGVATAKGCPDVDGDSIVDADDACVDVAGLSTFKGCPDADQDGIPEPIDQCPDAPETVNGNKDEDGCPDKGKAVVVVTAEKVELNERVFFDSGKAKIQRRSFKLLDQVALVLKANPRIKLVRVEGHTDNRGNDEMNKKLSQARADSVRNYLTSHGVEPERLVSVGYGEAQPIAENRSRSGREKNRRVELTILEQ